MTRYYLWSLPLTAVATVIGRAANRSMHPEAFARYVHIGLIALGVLLLSQLR